MKVEQVIQWLESGSRKEKRGAIQRVFVLAEKKQGKEAIPALLKLVDGSDEELACEAMWAINAFGDKKDNGIFSQHLGSGSAKMRGFCALTLAQRGVKSEAYPALRALLTSSNAAEREAVNADFAPSDFGVASISADELRVSKGAIPSPFLGAGHVPVGIITKVRERFEAKVYCEPTATTISPMQFKAIEHIEKLGKLTNSKIARELVRLHKEKRPGDRIERGEAFVLSAVIPRLDSRRDALLLSARSCRYRATSRFRLLVPGRRRVLRSRTRGSRESQHGQRRIGAREGLDCVKGSLSFNAGSHPSHRAALARKRDTIETLSQRRKIRKHSPFCSALREDFWPNCGSFGCSPSRAVDVGGRWLGFEV